MTEVCSTSRATPWLLKKIIWQLTSNIQEIQVSAIFSHTASRRVSRLITSSLHGQSSFWTLNHTEMSITSFWFFSHLLLCFFDCLVGKASAKASIMNLLKVMAIDDVKLHEAQRVSGSLADFPRHMPDKRSCPWGTAVLGPTRKQRTYAIN